MESPGGLLPIGDKQCIDGSVCFNSGTTIIHVDDLWVMSISLNTDHTFFQKNIWKKVVRYTMLYYNVNYFHML